MNKIERNYIHYDRTRCETEVVFGTLGGLVCDAHDRKVTEVKQGIYITPFARERIRVTVIDFAIRNGQQKVHILLPNKPWDLWVPVKRVEVL